MLENGTSSTIQCGRRIRDCEIGEIKETVDLCRRLSRYELAQTIAENLGWYTASGSLKVDACVKLLEKLQSEGILRLPEMPVLNCWRSYNLKGFYGFLKSGICQSQVLKDPSQ